MAKKATGGSAGSEQLKNDLKQKSLGRFYVLCGEEDYLCRHYLAQIKKQLLDDLTADFNYHHLTPENFDLQSLADSIEALPMMAERSLIQIDDVDFFELGEGDREAVTQLLGEFPDYCCLVLCGGEFKPDKRKKKLWEVLEKQAVIAEFAYQSESDLRAWIVRHFKAGGKFIAPELATYLLGQCGLSMTRLHGEIGKLCAYAPGDTVTREDIDAVVEPTLEAVGFEITDALGQREFDRALQRLHVMLKLRAEPISVLAAIGSQMRRLRAARVLLSEGRSGQELAELCGIAPFAANKTMTQARRLSDRFCERAVLLCRDCDWQMKTSYDEPQRILELLILSLAEEARHD